MVALVAGPDRVGRLARPPRLAAVLELAREEPTPPTVLALLGLAVTAVLYILQATSPNASSVRYLVPAWIVLPGLLAAAPARLPAPGRWAAACSLLVPWATAQANLWADLDRPSPVRPLADALDRRGVKGIVAETPVALMVANLTHGRVGALEYRSPLAPAGDRYADRFVAGRAGHLRRRPRRSPGPPARTYGWPLAPAIRPSACDELARRHPGRVRRVVADRPLRGLGGRPAARGNLRRRRAPLALGAGIGERWPEFRRLDPDAARPEPNRHVDRTEAPLGHPRMRPDHAAGA